VKGGWNFNQLIIVRAPGLLPMLYSPRELEQELGVPSRIIREWIKKGMPYQRDPQGHIWINGAKFAEWVVGVRKGRLRMPLEPDEAFCLKCKMPVKLINPRESHRGKLVLIQGKCSHCGSAVNRGKHFDQSK
jgi:hypothetical protein